MCKLFILRELQVLGSLFGIAKTRRPSRLVKQLEEYSIKSMFSPLGCKAEDSLPMDQTHGGEETTLQDASSTQGDTSLVGRLGKLVSYQVYLEQHILYDT